MIIYNHADTNTVFYAHMYHTYDLTAVLRTCAVNSSQKLSV